MTLEQRNILSYAMLAVAAFAIGCASALVPQLMDPSMPVLNWRIVAGTGITAIITATGGALLPRTGSTGIAAQVDSLKATGTDRKDMVVVSQDEAVPLLAGAFTPSQIAQVVIALHDPVANELQARMQRATAPTSVPDHIISLIDRDEGRG